MSVEEAWNQHHNTRAAVLRHAAKLRELRAELAQKTAALGELIAGEEAALTRAKRDLWAVVDKLPQLMHADAAGVCGKRETTEQTPTLETPTP